MVLAETTGERDLPRYFTHVFARAKQVPRGRLEIALPDGRCFVAEGGAPGPQARLEVVNPDVFARLLREGDLGFCEAYMDGWWRTPDLFAFLDYVHAAEAEMLDGFPTIGLVRLFERLRHRLRDNSRGQAKRNIAAHYDLGNEFYALWLDRTMTYSSARFDGPGESLEAAQQRKYATLLEAMQVRPGEHVLEIGCGWGGFAEFAARQGLRVTGLTISREQHDFARARIAKAGFADQVDIRLEDYRDARGDYDGIASIEMFEAVGEKYWPVFFDALRARLRPGRIAALQVICVQDARFEIYRRGVDFIQKHIFPGGMLPSQSALAREIERAGLQLRGSEGFGESYSATLRRWHAAFTRNWDAVAALGFDERFRRMWEFYLCACAATFSSGNCDVRQVAVQRTA
ncbi:cyclopropane-fatty-acyl-phospholipid synthase family protein [Tropicimonas sp. IMCC6043]|uniref:SAM-dependent methyltransferase n=1 Tax=Tropicimonas sp. IMCC6043 TaxID=2510645 RepID=UPI00101D7FC0|nr:cyclopropane-fatty-acyl-phospholipid synthase family protein [Tropicimonas sp. IMCC6043]RYH10273.1 class I SAM-dependent methyltransferase [Tropicimonas sp. IMCC6043]